MAAPNGPGPLRSPSAVNTMYRTVRLCAQGGGFEAVPEAGRGLDLGRVREALEAEGFTVLDARVLLVVAMDPEVTIARSGRLLFKTADGPVAQRALERLRPLLERSPAPTSRGRAGHVMA